LKSDVMLVLFGNSRSEPQQFKCRPVALACISTHPNPSRPPGWFDGYRIIARKDGERVRL